VAYDASHQAEKLGVTGPPRPIGWRQKKLTLNGDIRWAAGIGPPRPDEERRRLYMVVCGASHRAGQLGLTGPPPS
jgi:hypothetical protein